MFWVCGVWCKVNIDIIITVSSPHQVPIKSKQIIIFIQVLKWIQVLLLSGTINFNNIATTNNIGDNDDIAEVSLLVILSFPELRDLRWLKSLKTTWFERRRRITIQSRFSIWCWCLARMSYQTLGLWGLETINRCKHQWAKRRSSPGCCTNQDV